MYSNSSSIIIEIVGVVVEVVVVVMIAVVLSRMVAQNELSWRPLLVMSSASSW